jgi:general secretion pathway protein D
MRQLVLLIAVAGLLTSCATSKAFRAGEQAERRQDYDTAVLQYSKAATEKPDDNNARQSLARARLRASQEHVKEARRFVVRGLLKEALDAYRLALDLRPGTASIDEELREVEALQRSQTHRVSIQELKDSSRERALPGLALGPAAEEPLGLVFRGAGLKDAYQALGRAVGINFVFDPSLADSPVSLDLRDITFEQALTALAAAGKTLHRVMDQKVLLVLPDTPQKRKEYEQQIVKTIYLSNADLKETVDLLRVALGARRVAPVPGLNALTISDAPDRVAAAERIVHAVDKRRAEVICDVEIMEVNRNNLKEYGIQLTSGLEASGIDGIAGTILPKPSETFTLADNPYSKSSLVVSSLPGVIYRLLQSDASARLLANPQLRASEGQTATARFGDQVPVPVTTFAPISGGGIAQQPITSFEYKNVGVNIDITPRVHHDGDVTLVLKLEISALGAAGFQGLPTFSNRAVTTTIRLRDGETNILAGLIRDDERHSLIGTPGLASIPFLGRLFARNKDEVVQTDIVMTLTPHIIRSTELREEDLRSFPVGSEGSPLLYEAPVVPVVPPQRTAPAPAAPARIEPIRPPSIPLSSAVPQSGGD